MNICSATLIPSGISIPLIGFGTYKIKGEKLIYDCLEAALKANYRSIDTASVYRNEEDIGKALQTLLPKFNLSRSDIFLTSKLSPRDQGSEKCRAAFELSLKQLQTNYLDLFLIHWPGAQNLKVDDCQNKALREESWIELEKLYKEGKIKAIGVSNFNESHLESLLKIASVVPHVNQVEFHPLYKQDSLLSYCRQKGIVIQAYSSLGTTTKDSALLQHPVVQEVALHEGKTEAQVLLKWALQQGIGVLPKSTNPAHIEENARLDFKLSQKGLDLLSSITSEKKLAWDSSTVF